MPANQVKAKAAKAAEAGIKSITLERAKTKLGVQSAKTGVPGSTEQRWVWAMRGDEDHQGEFEDHHLIE